jgi:DNA-directed RNA polymerase subunit omega
MINELRDTRLARKIGGKFRLTALLQKRVAELVLGSRPLIENAKGMTNLEIAIQEVLEDKIAIDETSANLPEKE